MIKDEEYNILNNRITNISNEINNKFKQLGEGMQEIIKVQKVDDQKVGIL